MIRTIPDMQKFKKLYESLAMNMSIDEKNYIYSIFLEPDTAALIAENLKDGEHVQINYDINGNLLCIYLDDRELYVGV